MHRPSTNSHTIPKPSTDQLDGLSWRRAAGCPTAHKVRQIRKNWLASGSLTVSELENHHDSEDFIINR